MLKRYSVRYYFKSDSDTTVCLAEQTDLQKLFVIKRLRCKDSETEERFYWETQILKHLKHPNIPLLYDIQKSGDYYYIIEEYVEGESLKSAVRRRAISADTAIGYAIQLCDILEYLHGHGSGEILYLDCQPDNIILSENRLFLIDFGSSVYTENFSERSCRYGTVGYAAPELYEKNAKVTPAADIYGAGALLYYMLAGESPITAGRDGLKKIPSELKNIIKKCMRHNPKQRYASAKELSDALRKVKIKSASIKNKETAIPVISIAGADRRCGVTHLCMSLAKYLTKRGYFCILAEQISPGILMQLLECQKKEKSLYVKEGVFWYKGIGMLPFYGETVAPELEKIKAKSRKQPVIIKDYGCFCEKTDKEYLNGDVCILVGDGKPWEAEKFYKKIELLRNEKSIFVVNLTGGGMFYRFIRQRRQSFIRMPYFEKWWAPGRVGSEFLEQLFCEILNKKGG